MTARSRARHAKPSKAAPTIAAVGMTASFVALDVAVTASAASAATAADFAKLRQCESGDNYKINTGNGYSGAYQFDRGTWQGLGYSGLAYQASPATQDAAARKLQAQRGWKPWPACSRKLGLGSSRVVERAERSTPQRTAVTKPARTAVAPKAVAPKQVRAKAVPTTPPVFIGKPLTVADAGKFRIGARMWQARMADRGWKIDVDGRFGPQSARVAKAFAAQRDLAQAGLPGEVDKVVWDAAWRLPVS